MAKWQIVLTDRSYTPKGEITNFGGFTFNAPLSKLATASFNVRMDNPHAVRLGDADGFIKLYRDTVLQYVGPIITSEQKIDRDTQTLAVTSADAGWILGKRLAGKSGGGQAFSSATDRALIAKSLIDTTNTMSATGVITTGETMSAGSASTYIAGPYRPILECLAELGSPLDGFDWQIVPVENWSNGALNGSAVGYVRAKPVIGVARTNAVFEYGAGTRANVLNFTKTRTRDTQVTRVWHLANDPWNPVVRPTSEPSAAQSAWGYLEEVVTSANELLDRNTRGTLLDEHLTVRGFPRDIVKLTPHIDPGVTGRIPQPFVDYFPGDTITANIATSGRNVFSGSLRVFAINITVDQETGFERVDLTLEDDS